MKTPKSKMDYLREVTTYLSTIAALPFEEAEGYVLCWPGVDNDSPLFVGFGEDGKPFAGGLQMAKVFHHKFPDVINGRSEKAKPIPLPQAQLMCLRAQAGLIRTLCELGTTVVDPLTAFQQPMKKSKK